MTLSTVNSTTSTLMSCIADLNVLPFVADDILKNLDRHTHPEGKDVYTAIFTWIKSRLLMEYYHYMKNHNPDGKKIAAIFTFTANEDLMKDG